MNRYQEIYGSYKITLDQLSDLHKEYGQPGKIKGNVYNKRKAQLLDKLDFYKNKAKAIGINGNICHVYGKRQRPHIRNPKLMVVERFNLYFVNVTEEEASSLVKLHVRNAMQYTIKFIKPGIIITS